MTTTEEVPAKEPKIRGEILKGINGFAIRAWGSRKTSIGGFATDEVGMEISATMPEGANSAEVRAGLHFLKRLVDQGIAADRVALARVLDKGEDPSLNAMWEFAKSEPKIMPNYYTPADERDEQ